MVVLLHNGLIVHEQFILVVIIWLLLLWPHRRYVIRSVCFCHGFYFAKKNKHICHLYRFVTLWPRGRCNDLYYYVTFKHFWYRKFIPIHSYCKQIIIITHICCKRLLLCLLHVPLKTTWGVIWGRRWASSAHPHVSICFTFISDTRGT